MTHAGTETRRPTLRLRRVSVASGRTGVGLWAGGILLLLGFPLGCRTVEFYELERLNDRVMVFDQGGAKLHLNQKILYSREGSAGGLGASAGGGCGCQ